MSRVTGSSAPALYLMNADIAGGARALRLVGGRIEAIDEAAQPHDRLIDLDGARVLPGFINAHDHLQLNSMPAAPDAPRYTHVHQWIEAINARRRSDAEFEASIAVPRAARLLLGGVKNLLCGVTTVAHHDPCYPQLLEPGFPVRVLEHYGWSHSLDIDGEDAVARACAATPADRPWIVHAAEGVSARATEEFERLDALGCLRPNTVLVHGVGLTGAQRRRLVERGTALVWCPASNLRLFAATAGIDDLLASRRVALGTDSRLTGSNDLLEELVLAAALTGLEEPGLLRLITQDAATLLRLPDRGRLARGLRADLVVLPAGARLPTAHRSQVRLVMVGGEFRYGDRDLAAVMCPEDTWPIEVDGAPKALSRAIAEALRRAALLASGAHEPGVQILENGRRAA